MRRFLLLIAMPAIVSLAYQPSLAQSTRNTRMNEPGQPSEVVKKPLMIHPNINLGYLVGDVTQDVDDVWRRFTPGFGIGADYAILPDFRIGVRTDLMWSWPRAYDNSIIRMWSYGFNTLWLLRPEGNSSLYLRGELGAASLNATEIEREDGGTHLMWKLGIGLQTFTGGTRSTREEIYYRVIYTEDHEVGMFGFWDKVPYNISQFGFEFMFGFGL